MLIAMPAYLDRSVGGKVTPLRYPVCFNFSDNQMKPTTNSGLSDAQLLARLAKLCDDVQSAIGRAQDQREILEAVRDVAQELLSDVETRPSRRHRRGVNTSP